ncbi:MAG: hypothetical protein GF334_12970 [Candidatus Altiarchaeales archaeon]|nr:hypothetical protein [Candidatus Altiarchaeales archaeon]
MRKQPDSRRQHRRRQPAKPVVLQHMQQIRTQKTMNKLACLLAAFLAVGFAQAGCDPSPNCLNSVKVMCGETTPEQKEYIKCWAEIICGLHQIGTILALLFTVIAGMRWMMAEDPQSKDNAKRSIIYILIGLLLLFVGGNVILYLLCA